MRIRMRHPSTPYTVSPIFLRDHDVVSARTVIVPIPLMKGCTDGRGFPKATIPAMSSSSGFGSTSGTSSMSRLASTRDGTVGRITRC